MRPWFLLMLLGGCSANSGGDETAVETTSSVTRSPSGATSSATSSATGSTSTSASGCNPQTGLDAPLGVCSADDPCTQTSGGEPITEDAAAPSCPDGVLESGTDADGAVRYRCRTSPDDAGPEQPYPLVLFFHGSFGSADDVYDYTSLPAKAADFHLVSIHGRALHWPTADPRDGAHHDIYFRDLGVPSANPDVAHADAVIDALVAEGGVDPDRIFVSGWSNGAHFAQLYAIARHETPTPGGNRVAAAAVYSAADPFHDTRADDATSCQLDPYPTSDVPILVVSRVCDLIACDEAQASELAEEDYVPAPGAVVETWMSDLSERVGPNGEWLLIDGWGEVASECAGWCSLELATINHVRWPDGVADGGSDHQIAMLDFLWARPL